MPKTITLKDDKALEAWFARADARKAAVHPEHPDFVATCKRCVEFRASLFSAN